MPDVTPPGTHWLEINTKDCAGLLEKLHDYPGVRQATIFGQSIHALVDRDCALQDLGSEVTMVETEPSLEDVFVTLSRAQAQNSG